ncbi:MAG: hypothetical protein GX590_08400 [Lentisphaerae bacterium]|nr:hypothetical protein [Lentisphaerota bacterium]
MFARYAWIRHAANPVLPPVPGSAYDSTRCMNPFVVRDGDVDRLFYSGADDAGDQRICLAEAPAGRVDAFRRRGAVLEPGAAGCFDAKWCVLPQVYRIGARWHLYYTGFEGSNLGLQGFPGIGLATSDDGLHFTRVSPDPIITGDQTAEFPHNRGIAGGGTILTDRRPDGTLCYRMYYTLAVGKPSPDVHVDQEKHCAVCHSTDGIVWTDHRLLLSPRREVGSEDIAVAAPFVWRDGDIYRMLYCGIGTRWGWYSIAEAYSLDGYQWERGSGDENLSLAPGAPGAWDSQMVEYPCVIPEPDGVRLFYCGNGYGKTGIGTAFARRPKTEAGPSC